MHDPQIVAFTIRRPWPRRDSMRRAAAAPWFEWQRHGPWWKPRSWSPFVTIAWRHWYFPSVVTIWHVEPRGHDSGEVCPHYRRWQNENGQWQSRSLRGWRWHVMHWKIQIHPAQALRRRALTRCAWCGGRSIKGDAVNISHSWDHPRGRWWQSEPGLFHRDCSSVESTHRMCLCTDPLLAHNGYGTCARCGKFRGYRSDPDEGHRILAALPIGGRITPDLRPRLDILWAERRARREATGRGEGHQS